MGFWADTHSHIYSTEFDADRDAMLDRSRQAGVALICMPNVDETSIEGMLALEARHPDFCYSMMGLHPCSVTQDVDQQLSLVETWLSNRRFVAVGEIGTDLYWDKTYWQQQQEAFVQQIKWAIKYRLPAVIHCRQSMDETLNLLEPLHVTGLTGIFHCFSGDLDQAKRILGLGFFLGIGGVATFKNGGLDRVLPHVDVSKLVLETDSPYLAPVPYRGKRNEPSYIPIIARRVSELTGATIEDIQTTTSRNAIHIFNIKGREQ